MCVRVRACACVCVCVCVRASRRSTSLSGATPAPTMRGPWWCTCNHHYITTHPSLSARCVEHALGVGTCSATCARTLSHTPNTVDTSRTLSLSLSLSLSRPLPVSRVSCSSCLYPHAQMYHLAERRWFLRGAWCMVHATPAGHGQTTAVKSTKRSGNPKIGRPW